MSRIVAYASVGMVLLLAALWLILVAAIAFVLGGGKNLSPLVPYLAFAVFAGASGAGYLVTALRLPLSAPRAR